MPDLILPTELSLLSALFLILTSFITSAISATFGLGGGIAMLSALLSVTTPAVAIPVHAIVQVGSNAGRAWLMRSHIMLNVVRWFVPGSVLGVIIASQVFSVIPTKTLQTILAIFIIWSLWAPKFKARSISNKAYFGVGAFGSFCTMFLGATGPILAAFLTPDRYGRDNTVASHAACMTLQHLLKLVAFGFIGFVFTDWLVIVIAMLSSGWLGTLLGKNLLQRFSEQTFKRVFKITLTLLAVRLLYSVWS